MKKFAFFFVVWLALTAVWLSGEIASPKTVLLNVSYDVIRDFYKAYNPLFRRFYQAENQQDLMISQSHGSASKQALSVAGGLPADVVTLTQSNDIDMLVQKGLIDAGWRQRLPNNATPFGSVMVLLVRKGNPKGIRDWSDLARDDVSVIFANPKTSANGRFAYLSAFAYARKAFGDERQVLRFMRRLLSRVPVLEAGARGASVAFIRRGLGDVLITPENEAALAVRALEAADFELIYPSYTAYTPVLVAEVTKNTAVNGTRRQARAYLRHLWSEEAQILAAQNHFRPGDEKIRQKYTALFPPVNTFDVNAEFGDWPAINQRHFADNALFDRLYTAAQTANDKE